MLFYSFIFAILFFLYKIDTHNIIYQTFNNKFYRIKRKNKIKFILYWFSFKLILHALYINIIQYMNNSLIKIRKNKYLLQYVINGKNYKMVIQPKKGTPFILQIIDGKDNDVTDIIYPYIGPSYDWHNYSFTPSFFNYDSLTFELADGSEKSFSKNEILSKF